MLALPDNVDTSKVDAEMNHGVLSVKVPKVEQEGTKAIDIQVK